MFSWIKSRSRARDLGACEQMNTAINRRACARGSILAACTPCILLKGAREKENSRLFEHKNYSSTGILLIHQKLYVSKTPWLPWVVVCYSCDTSDSLKAPPSTTSTTFAHAQTFDRCVGQMAQRKLRTIIRLFHLQRLERAKDEVNCPFQILFITELLSERLKSIHLHIRGWCEKSYYPRIFSSQ